ncbi:MAG TPA: glycosyltransferase [Pyrinomonadaceae bacterium]|jgi:glycosyltransferase involved in cell wall biosynthesis|nr:glycosyltransferase [Pyrinomonadaceae bacterium]
MKIVRIIARLNVGGPARHVIWLTDRLKGLGHQTLLLAGTVPEGEADMGYFASQNGVEPVIIPELSRELSPKDLISLFKILRILRRERPDIVHTHTAKAGTIGRVAAMLYRYATPGTLIGRPRRVKVVHTFHGHVLHSYYGRSKTTLFAAIERVLAGVATDRIVVISDQQLNEICNVFRVGRRNQYSVIPLGINMEGLETRRIKRSLRSEIRADENDLIVGFFGRLTDIKDIPLLLDAIKAYQDDPEANKPQLRLVIVGDGELRSPLETQVSRVGLSLRVSFLGHREDIADLIAQTDIVVLTSRNEGTPLSLIEAMAVGKLVVSTAVGGVVDLLGAPTDTFDGFDIRERGIGVTTRDPADIARALIYIAKNERLRKSLATEGQRFVRARYSIDRLVKDINDLYAELEKES